MNGNVDGEWIGGTQSEIIRHYKQRLRAMLPYVMHKRECAYSKWEVAEYLQKSYGTGYSAGPMPACTCGAAVIIALVRCEVYDEHGNPV